MLTDMKLSGARYNSSINKKEGVFHPPHSNVCVRQIIC